ncbi:hypothetical protein JXQ31_01560 [candidate division KSB1 bacterium]|nr:hypothetical protein [candidate division KSB1 bacterium]
MKKLFNTFLLFLLLVNSLPAQSERSDFQKLNNRITTAKELLRTFPDPQAKLLVQDAEKQRNEAISLYNSNRKRLAVARIKTALALVNRAIDLLSRVPLERLKEQVDELIRKAEQLSIGENSKEAERLLQQAKQNRNRSVTAFQRRDNWKAMEHLRVAKFYAEKAVSILQGPKGNIQENLNDEKLRYEELLQRAREIVFSCNNDQAHKLLNQALNQFQNIRRALQNGNYQIALNLYYSNTRLLLRAIDLCQGQEYSLREQAVEELELFGDLLASAREQPTLNGNRQNTFILQRASRLYQQADDAIKAENFAMAIRHTTMGKAVLSRLWGGESSQSLPEKTEQELEQLRAEIETIKSNAEILDDKQKGPLLRAAESSAADAERFLARGRVRLALESIFAGNRFLSAIDAGDKQKSDIDAVRLRENLARLKDAIILLENSEQKDESTEPLLQEAGKMLQKAQSALDKNQLELANEYIKLGNDLINKVNSTSGNDLE